MTEAGFAILRKRANKLPHRSSRVLRRSHRSNSFGDEADPLGHIIQHPKDRWSSDEEGDNNSEEEREREYEARIARHRQRMNATAVTALSQSTQLLTAAEVTQRYESQIMELTKEIREREAETRRVEAKLKHMMQWKQQALATKEFNPYDVGSSTLEILEPTRLRFYSLLRSKALAHDWVRSFRLRKIIKHLHSNMVDIVKKVAQQRMNAQRGLMNEQLTKQQQQLEQIMQQCGVTTRGAASSTISSSSTLSTTSSFDPSSLIHPAPALGSLTDESESGVPLSVRTSSATLPTSDPRKVQLQSELHAWLTHNHRLMRNGYRGSGLRGERTREDVSSCAVTSLHRLMSNMTDCGPVLRCLVEDMLNSYGESRATLASFIDRTTELKKQLSAGEREVANLEEERNKWEEYSQRCANQLAQLIKEHRAVRNLLTQHTKYESQLSQTHKQLSLIQSRQLMEARRQSRQLSQFNKNSKASWTGTGGLGISSHLLAQARAQHEADVEQARQSLLREVIQQQELSRRNAAQQSQARSP